MSKINFTLTASLNEVKTLIQEIGDTNTIAVISEPGVGKSSILAMLAQENGDKWRKAGDDYPEDKYDYVYVDCPVKDMMDIAASIPNHQERSLEYYVSSLFKLKNGKPKYIMLDEAFKAPKLMQIIYTRMMLERTVGDSPLTNGSRLFITSNNASDGVGDSYAGHVANRITIVNMKKPTHDEWLQWATENNISRPLRAWAAMTPKAFKSYLDPDQTDNPYIFKPSSTAKSFVSPRSLAKASPIVEKRHKYSENALTVALAGTVGESAAKSIATFISVEHNMIKFTDVLADPMNVKVPEDIATQVMMILEAVDTLTSHDDLNKYMQFVKRMKSSEIQSIFFTMMFRNKPKIARYNTEINNWATENIGIM